MKVRRRMPMQDQPRNFSPAVSSGPLGTGGWATMSTVSVSIIQIIHPGKRKEKPARMARAAQAASLCFRR
jgi:hypothetical protein